MRSQEPEQQPFEIKLLENIFVSVLIGFFLFATGGVCKTLEVFLRRQFGHRFLGGITVIGMFFLLLTFSLWAREALYVNVALFRIFCVAFLVVGLCHWIGILKRKLKGDLTSHSRYSGKPWDFWYDLPLWKYFPCTEMRIKTYFDPLLCFLVGWIIAAIDMLLGGYIVFASVLLFFRGLIARAIVLRDIYDSADGQIYARGIVDTVSDVTTGQGMSGASSPVRGAPVTSRPPVYPEEVAGATKDHLDPGLRDLLEPGGTNQPAAEPEPPVESIGKLINRPSAPKPKPAKLPIFQIPPNLVRLDEEGRVAFPCTKCSYGIAMEPRFSGRVVACQQCSARHVVPHPPQGPVVA